MLRTKGFGPIITATRQSTAVCESVTADFVCLQAAEVWESVHTRLLAHAQESGKLSWEVSADSTTARGHVRAAGPRKDSPTRRPG